MKLPRRRFLHLAAAAAVLPTLPQIAKAQTLPAPALSAPAWPTRPVRIIVPFGPGGPTDIFGRLIAQKLSEQSGKQFYVENILGGAGNVGTGQAARAAPDGHTILLNVSAFVTNPAFTKAPYDPVGDFAPVSVPVASAIAILVHPSVPARTMADLVALIRANPGKYSYATGGAGAQPHLAFEQFRVSLGLDIVHIPFNGAGPAVAALVAGHVMIGISSLPPAMEQIRERNLRALALTSKTRSHKLPDIPTVAEAGYPVLEGDQWLGVFVPVGTPREIISTLHRKIDEFVAQQDMKAHLEALDFYPVESTPEAFAERIKSELATWRNVIRMANIRAE